MTQQTADFDHSTDWGMRINSNRSPSSAERYHYAFRCGRCLRRASVRGKSTVITDVPAYANSAPTRCWRWMVARNTNGVLSGDYYQALCDSSAGTRFAAACGEPHFARDAGLEADCDPTQRKLRRMFPRLDTVPVLRNVRLGKNTLLINYAKTDEGIVLDTGLTSGSEECSVGNSPCIQACGPKCRRLS